MEIWLSQKIWHYETLRGNILATIDGTISISFNIKYIIHNKMIGNLKNKYDSRTGVAELHAYICAAKVQAELCWTFSVHCQKHAWSTTVLPYGLDWQNGFGPSWPTLYTYPFPTKLYNNLAPAWPQQRFGEFNKKSGTKSGTNGHTHTQRCL